MAPAMLPDGRVGVAGGPMEPMLADLLCPEPDLGLVRVTDADDMLEGNTEDPVMRMDQRDARRGCLLRCHGE
jgi:hypothetical protein